MGILTFHEIFFKDIAGHIKCGKSIYIYSFLEEYRMYMATNCWNYPHHEH